MPSLHLTSEWMPVVDAILKPSIAIGLAALAAALLGRATAALRHVVWTLALAATLALPILAMAMPAWHLPVFDVQPADAAARVTATQPMPAGDHATRPAPARRTAGAADTGLTAPATPSAERDGRGSWIASVAGPQVLWLVWLAGAGFVLARVLAGLAAMRWYAQRTQPATDAPWLELARESASRLGVDADVRFRRSGLASMPLTTGILRPTVILPRDADGWSASRVRIVLLHELAHVKRRDCLTHLIAQLACAVYWFNPLVWMAARRARVERERACDDLVLATGTRGPDYADGLLDVARAMRHGQFPGLLASAGLAMAYRTQLEGRLMAILDPKIPHSVPARRSILTAAALCCCTVAPLGALQTWKADVPRHAMLRTGVEPAALTAEGVVSTLRQAPAAPAHDGALAAPSAGATSVQHSNMVLHDAATPPTLFEVVGRTVRHLFQAQPATPVVPARPVKQAQPPQPVQPNPGPNPKPNPGVTPVEKTGKADKVEKDSDEDDAEAGERRKADPRTIAALTAAMKDTDAEVRQAAMHSLVHLRDKRAVQPLIAAMKDASAGVREHAAHALGQLRDPAAIDALGAALRDASADVREQAVHALGEIGDRRAGAQLVAALKDASPDVRQQAAHALGQLGDRTAIDALVVAISDAVADVREEVVCALGELGDPRAIDALTTALKDKSVDVRRQAAHALGQLDR